MSAEPEKVRLSPKAAKALRESAQMPEELTERETAELLEKVAKKLRGES